MKPQPVGVAVEEAVRGSGSGARHRRPSCRSTPHPGAPPGPRPRAPWRRPRASARRRRRRRSRRRRRRARGMGRGPVSPVRRRGWGPDEMLREPAGWIRCPLAAMVPPALAPHRPERPSRGKKKARSTLGAGRGVASVLTLPGRSRGADDIKENDRKGGALHERIIMHDHVFVNLPVVPSAARDLVTRVPETARQDPSLRSG